MLDKINKLLHYDIETGTFTYKVSVRYGLEKGSIAGTIQSNGYVTIRISGKDYKAHRVAWLIVTGEWPDQCIDHINRKRSDNRFCNLREATRAQNVLNAKVRKDSRTGLKGIYFDEASKKYKVVIRKDGKQHYVGRFKTPEEAVSAHKIAAYELHGDFSYYVYNG